MTQPNTSNISQPQDCSIPSLHLGETEAQKSAPPEAPKKTRPERLGLGLLIPQPQKAPQATNDST